MNRSIVTLLPDEARAEVAETLYRYASGPVCACGATKHKTWRLLCDDCLDRVVNAGLFAMHGDAVRGANGYASALAVVKPYMMVDYDRLIDALKALRDGHWILGRRLASL